MTFGKYTFVTCDILQSPFQSALIELIGLYVVCVNVSYGSNVAAPKSTLIYVTHAWVVVQAWDLLIYVLFLHVVYVYIHIC